MLGMYHLKPFIKGTVQNQDRTVTIPIFFKFTLFSSFIDIFASTLYPVNNPNIHSIHDPIRGRNAIIYIRIHNHFLLIVPVIAHCIRRRDRRVH